MQRVRGFFAGRRIVLPAAIAAQLLILLRNMIVARALGPEQFALAVVFLLAQQFFESATDAGLNKYLLQNRAGNRPSLQAMVQFVSIARGATAALLIMAIAYPAFGALRISDELLPFLLLAGVSLAFGFLHFDNARQQRAGNFTNDSLSTVAAEIAGLVAAAVALTQTRSYVVVLYALMARMLVQVAVSHMLARRRYVVRFSREFARDVLRFSAPLMVNGPLLFLASQGDRIFVSAVLGLRELGIYSAAMLLLASPMALLTKVLGTIFIPRMSGAFKLSASPDDEVYFCGWVLTIYLFAVTGFMALGPIALPLIFGSEYRQAALPVALIGLVQGVRFLRIWPTGIALSLGHTGNLLFATIVRFASLPLGLAGLLVIGGLSGLSIGLLAGEALALTVSLIALDRRRAVSPHRDFRLLAVAFAMVLALPSLAWLTGSYPLAAAGLAFGLLIAAIVALLAIDRRLVPRDLSVIGW